VKPSKAAKTYQYVVTFCRPLMFSRPDGTHGFEEFRRDAEDRGAWTPVQFTQEGCIPHGRDPLVADLHNFYKVEKWTRDGTNVDSLFYAGNSLGRARSVFEHAIKHRTRIRLTIRQRTRVLGQWPPPQRRTQ
jgi:hypothetical protein